MKQVDYTGFEKVFGLIENGLTLKQIKEHNDAEEFFSYHKQGKTMIIKKIIEDPTIKDAMFLIMYNKVYI